jgi:hypothetical protein
MAKVFKLSSYPLTISEVVDYLKDPPAELINSIPPSEPKGGEVYLFQGTEDKKGNRDELRGCQISKVNATVPQ